MIEAKQFIATVGEAGFDFYTGVPCSLLTPLINELARPGDHAYIGATSEGEAVGIAAGAWLAGRLPVVFMQNSGLGNAVNPLTSLNHPFQIPALVLVTWRGRPGVHDEPQHKVMGEITPRLLDLLGIRHDEMPDDPEKLLHALRRARDHMETSGLPYALVVREGTFGNEHGSAPTTAFAADNKQSSEVRDFGAEALLSRFEALQQLVGSAPASAGWIATTGKSGRELFTICDREQHLYLVGSMGCASAVAFGAAVNTSRPIVAIDGDGAALMKLGNWATIGAQAPKNLVHVLLDNGVHDSTGGQPTVSRGVDFASIAKAAGYRTALRCGSADGLTRAIDLVFSAPGPHLLHVLVKPGSVSPLGRPTVEPPAVARRFQTFLRNVP